MSKALDKFREQRELVDRLVSICESATDDNHDALSRAGVVFCVAFWQAYVENVIMEAYESIRSKIRSSDADEIALLKKFFKLNKNY